MAWERTAHTLTQLLSLLKINGVIKDMRVEEAMTKIDRKHFCPSSHPYTDQPWPIGWGATISAPHMHAYALESVKDKLVPGAKVLDIGSGTGYLTACMAHMVGPEGRVYGVEHIQELVDMSIANLKKNDCHGLNSDQVKIFSADGRVGLPEYGPYDVIHVGATAPEFPQHLVDQLKEGGILVVPVQRGEDQYFESYEKLPGGQKIHKQILRVVYVPLTDRDSQLKSAR